jgi:hypothetical protein
MASAHSGRVLCKAIALILKQTLKSSKLLLVYLHYSGREFAKDSLLSFQEQTSSYANSL